ncbi:hypothetical protein GGS23DRAFT_560542 [Durotheca rogersii]|uniref:uncharacterized protein n=1 Tax=Durotheca rogersii TaxID=419775 RepID=UPI00221F3797|nr:uncharacterized protein GGS23DRAFT_560542 [Durotheca rogersii]KAI5864513.1 hypothetical protein GGS23DRAFT_560542 [Durotheca rogersii]
MPLWTGGAFYATRARALPAALIHGSTDLSLPFFPRATTTTAAAAAACAAYRATATTPHSSSSALASHTVDFCTAFGGEKNGTATRGVVVVVVGPRRSFSRWRRMLLRCLSVRGSCFLTPSRSLAHCCCFPKGTCCFGVGLQGMAWYCCCSYSCS